MIAWQTPFEHDNAAYRIVSRPGWGEWDWTDPTEFVKKIRLLIRKLWILFFFSKIATRTKIQYKYCDA